MDHKKLFRSQETRMKILKALSFIPDKPMVILQYLITMGRIPNLRNPRRYTEKLQWLKLYYRNPLMTQCCDKYQVRQYVKEKGYATLLTELYGSYMSPNEISFDQLPQKFIIKTTNGSGTNIICNDKDKLNIKETINELNAFLNRPHISAGREWAYNNINNRIIIEELLEDRDNPYGGINDYKFICFNGKVYCIVVDVGRYTHHLRNFYTVDWKRLDIVSDHNNFEPDAKHPEKLAEMIKIAEKLSEDFPAVRVDLYSVNNKLYFGELTFYPWSGYVQFTPDAFDFELGENFVLPDRLV
jgi:hypothetical protein